MSSSEWYRLPLERGPTEASRIYLRRFQILAASVALGLIMYGGLWLFTAPEPWPWLVISAGTAMALFALTRVSARTIARREQFLEDQLQSRLDQSTAHREQALEEVRLEHLFGQAQSRLRVALQVADPRMRRSLLRTLESEAIHVFGETASLHDPFAGTLPDVVLLDVRLPNELTSEEVRGLLGEHPGVSIIMLTASGDPLLAANVLYAGARGYLLRDHAGAELVETLQRVVSGRTVIDPHIVVPLARELLGVSEDDSVENSELEILSLLASGDTVADIARKLDVTSAILRTHVLHIFEKLRVSDRGVALAEALRIGARTDPED